MRARVGSFHINDSLHYVFVNMRALLSYICLWLCDVLFNKKIVPSLTANVLRKIIRFLLWINKPGFWHSSCSVCVILLRLHFVCTTWTMLIFTEYRRMFFMEYKSNRYTNKWEQHKALKIHYKKLSSLALWTFGMYVKIKNTRLHYLQELKKCGIPKRMEYLLYNT